MADFVFAIVMQHVTRGSRLARTKVLLSTSLQNIVYPDNGIIFCYPRLLYYTDMEMDLVETRVDAWCVGLGTANFVLAAKNEI